MKKILAKWVISGMCALLAACAVITVNVYFPEKDVKKAYKSLDEMLLKQGDNADEALPAEEPKTPEKKPVSGISGGPLRFALVGEVFAEEDISDELAAELAKMPEVQKAYAEMRARLPQLNALRRGTHVVVGTPGRVIDHLERGTLSLGTLRFVVLDEADEMLQMGFVDAIESILSRAPRERQTALFSATLPPPIRRIAQQHLRSPQEVTIRSATSTATNIRQRYWVVSGMHKLDALTRILEVEAFDAMLVYARTKQATVELAERLEARGFAAAALNGDMVQAQRERTIAALKSGEVDIVVATDVAARGIDVERISHVVNFDVPYDSESYVHRIGRTGRAGRSGEAILFIAPRERNMLRIIERATRQPIEPMALPTVEDVNQRRVARFKARLAEALQSPALEAYRPVIEEFVTETDADIVDVAAALAGLAQGKQSLLLDKRKDEPAPAAPQRLDAGDEPSERKPRRRKRDHDEPQATFRLEVGRRDGVQPANIVGAIAHTADLAGSQINGVDIREDHTLVRLPASLSLQVLSKLRRVRVRGKVLDISRLEGGSESG